MPRRILGIFILLLVSVFHLRAQGDVALLKVGHETVGVEEFECHLSMSSEKCLDVFAQTLACFKQKVLAAKELGLDTLDAYRRQREYSQRTWAYREAKVKGVEWNATSEKEWIKLVHITCPLSQHASKMEERRMLAHLDSLYATLREYEYASFQSLPWTQTRFLLNEWQNQLNGLGRGEFSKPFRSPLGVHIIAWTDKQMVEVMDGEASMLSGNYRLKQMEEGLLVSSLEEHLEKVMVCTPQELEVYFQQHKMEYGWGVPHYRGAVIHCRNKKEAKRIKAYLQKYPEEMWQEAWKRMPADVSEGGLMDTGLFAIGENPYIDKLVFKCGEFDLNPDYPYVWVLGKKMKKGPESYKDVSTKVEKNFRKVKKETEMEALVQKYKVEIDEEVLKTVNRWGNK